MNPKISIIIGTYNFGRYLRECIESVLSQTLLPSEIIICDDNSSDNSSEIIIEYKKRFPKLIKTFIHEKKLGAAKNGNFGLSKATGDLVSQIEGDDRWFPQKLELEWKALYNNPEAQIVYSNVYPIDAEGKRKKIWHNNDGSPPPSGDVFVNVFSRRFFSNTSSIFRNELVRRFAFDKEAYCDLNLESYWDWDRKIRYSIKYPVVYSGEALVEYRQHKGGFSKQHPEIHFRAFVKIYEKHLPLLKGRTLKEKARVKCRIESLIALQQSNLSGIDYNEKYSFRNVHSRNQQILNQLNKADRQEIIGENADLLMKVVQKAIMEELSLGNRITAFKYFLNYSYLKQNGFDFRLAAKILFSG